MFDLLTLMAHKQYNVTVMLVLAVKMVKIGVYYIYGSYCKIKTGVPLFWTTRYIELCHEFTR